MKKVIVFIGMMVLGFSAYSQDLRFTKGDVAPGQMKNGRAYEDFLLGNIKVTDNAGNVYNFVKADLIVLSRDGSKLEFSLSQNGFTEKQVSAIINADDEGTTYTFANITVKDSSGKEYNLTEVKYQFPSIQR